MRIRDGILLFAAVFAAPALLGAEEPERKEEAAPKPPQAETQYVEVDVGFLPESNTIASKLPLPLERTPANVGAVGEALLREQNATLLSDALRNISGVNVQENAGVHDFFLIRGFDSLSGGLVLTDGAAEPEATHYPLYNVEGVEVLKGPAGFLYGSDPLAGVVNIVRKQPLPADFCHLSGSLGSWSSEQAAIDWNLADDAGARSFRLNTVYLDSEAYRDGRSSRLWGVNPAAAFELGPGKLHVNLEYVSADDTPDAGLPILDGSVAPVPRRRSYATPFDFSEQSIARVQLDWEQPLGERVTLRNKLYLRDLDWQTGGTQFAGLFPDGAGGYLVGRYFTSLDDRQRLVGNQLEALFRFDSGPVEHHLLAGLELERLSDRFDIGVAPPADPLQPQIPGIPAIALFDPVETATAPTPFPFLVGESRSFVAAPYLVDQIKLPSAVDLLVGARLDRISRDDDRAATSPAATESISRVDTEVSPMAGLVWTPRAALSLYANASRSFSPAGVRVFGELEPEQSTGYELGVKQRWLDGRLKTTYAAFRIDRTNVAIPDDNGVTQQAGDQQSRGLEIEIAAEPRPRLHAIFSYAYTDAELERFAERVIVGFDPLSGQPIEATIDRSGNSPAFVPEHLGSLWVGYRFPRGLGLAGGARYIGEQFIAEDNATTIDAAIVLDATLSYDLRRCRLNLFLKNLTDERYERRGFGGTSVIPADGFSVAAGFEFRL